MFDCVDVLAQSGGFFFFFFGFFLCFVLGVFDHAMTLSEFFNDHGTFLDECCQFPAVELLICCLLTSRVF